MSQFELDSSWRHYPPFARIDSGCITAALGFAMPASLMSPVKSAIRAAVHLICHLAVAAVILVGIRLLELLIQWLWRSQEPMLFGFLPLKYIVHGGDLAVLVAFGYYGIISVAKGFQERR